MDMSTTKIIIFRRPNGERVFDASTPELQRLAMLTLLCEEALSYEGPELEVLADYPHLNLEGDAELLALPFDQVGALPAKLRSRLDTLKKVQKTFQRNFELETIWAKRLDIVTTLPPQQAITLTVSQTENESRNLVEALFENTEFYLNNSYRVVDIEVAA